MTLTSWLVIIGGFIAAAILSVGAEPAPSAGDSGEPAPAPAPDTPPAASSADVSPGVMRLAAAISVAEGYGADPSNAPTRANNPGSLKIAGYPVTGAEGISVFPTPQAGWNALYLQVQEILSGESKHYTSDMTIAQMAAEYTDTQGVNWAANVVATLRITGVPGATTGTTIAEATV
jgi:hypothetical protein